MIFLVHSATYGNIFLPDWGIWKVLCLTESLIVEIFFSIGLMEFDYAVYNCKPGANLINVTAPGINSTILFNSNKVNKCNCYNKYEAGKLTVKITFAAFYFLCNFQIAVLSNA